MSFASTAERPAAAALRGGARGRTLVVGLGNPLRGDDGVGWRVVEELREALAGSDACLGGPGAVELDTLAVGGIRLMERLVGYERAILVDALCSAEAPVGTVSCRPLANVPTRAAAHLDSAHDAPLPAALDAGRALGAALPLEILAVGIEIEPDDRFDDRLSPPVANAVAPAVEAVLSAIAGS